MEKLLLLIKNNEEWLMQRILDYSHKHGYVRYTSTLREAWRISIQELSDSICNVIKSGNDVELSPDEDFSADHAASFGIIEAKKHRERGIPYSMFMGLFKYYRESYIDLMKEQAFSRIELEQFILFISRIFDRIEIGFSTEWAELSGGEKLDELKNSNRMMTNEKNMFLTVVESLGSPVFFLDGDRRVVYINSAASRLLKLSPVPGGYYYNRDNIKIELPAWITEYSDSFFDEGLRETCFEQYDHDSGSGRAYQGRISIMEDVSGKFTGCVMVLNDITDRLKAQEKITEQRDQLEKALSDIKTLRGIVPICASCKKIRNDEGFWDQVETYISEHSEVQLSHGLCPDCIRKYYPHAGNNKG